MNEKPIQLIAFCGTILCLLAVIIGAFGAHALEEVLAANQRQGVFELANRYQFYHGLALILMAALFRGSDSRAKLYMISGLMLLGTSIFCCSLYLLALMNLTWLGAITPIGGIFLIVAWGLFAVRILKF